MEARKIKLVQDSFETVASMGTSASQAFYAELFAIDPTLQAMFDGSMEDQHRKLLSALSLVVRSLHTPDKIFNSLEKLAVKHLEYGVQPEHYTYVGNALLRTLKKALGPDFTPDLCDAWTDAYRMLARVMKEAAYGRPKLLADAIG